MKYNNIEGVPNFVCNEFKKKSTKYCLCIPIINEGKRIIEELKRGQNNKIDKLVDIIICDGGSTDGSTDYKKLSQLGVNTIIVKTGKGKQGAQLRTGFYFALERGYEGIITIDGNNKDSIEDIPKFIEKLDEGYDFVQGSRFIKGGKAINTPLIRYLSVKLLHAPIISLTAREKFTDTTNAFRAYSKKYLSNEKVNVFREIFNTYELLAYLSVRASQLGMKTCEVPVTREYPKEEKTPTKISGVKGNYNLFKILLLNMFGKYDYPKKTFFEKLFSKITISIILILLLISACFFVGYKRIIDIDFFAINGDFQSYNVWRRVLYGQIPFKDFMVYLGSGHLFLGAILTYIFGGTFASSLRASYFLTLLLSCIIIYIINFCILKKHYKSLLLTSFLIILIISNNKIINSTMLFSLSSVSTLIYSPGNSARIIRGSIVILGAIFILTKFNKYIDYDYNTLEEQKHKKILSGAIKCGVFASLMPLWSNDMGMSSFGVFSLLYFINILKKYEKDYKAILKILMNYGISFLCSIIVIMLIITKCHPLSLIFSTISTSQAQSWYYLPKNYSVQNINFSIILVIPLFILIINLIDLIKKRNIDKYKLSITYILFTLYINYLLYYLFNGSAIYEYLYIVTYTMFIASLIKFMGMIINKFEFLKKYRFVNKYNLFSIVILIIMLFSYVPTIEKNYNKWKNSGKKRVYISELGGNISTITGNAINTLNNRLNNSRVFSTYASAYEAANKQFQPSGYDYIIHVFGEENRKKYVENFINNDYKYVLTINRDYTSWEDWIRNANWFFYRELYKNYKPIFTTYYNVVWEKQNEQFIINNIDYNIKTEKKQNSFFITIETSKNINGVADVMINYNSIWKKDHLLNGYYNKQIFIYDMSSDRDYGDYNVPPSSKKYYIPIKIINGKGEAILTSYPGEYTELIVNDIVVKNIFKDPFENKTTIIMNEKLEINKEEKTITVLNTKRNERLLREYKYIKYKDFITKTDHLYFDEQKIVVEVESTDFPNEINNNGFIEFTNKITED